MGEGFCGLSHPRHKIVFVPVSDCCQGRDIWVEFAATKPEISEAFV